MSLSSVVSLCLPESLWSVFGKSQLLCYTDEYHRWKRHQCAPSPNSFSFWSRLLWFRNASVRVSSFLELWSRECTRGSICARYDASSERGRLRLSLSIPLSCGDYGSW